MNISPQIINGLTVDREAPHAKIINENTRERDIPGRCVDDLLPQFLTGDSYFFAAWGHADGAAGGVDQGRRSVQGDRGGGWGMGSGLRADDQRTPLDQRNPFKELLDITP